MGRTADVWRRGRSAGYGVTQAGGEAGFVCCHRNTIIHEAAHLAGFGGDSYRKDGIDLILRNFGVGEVFFDNADTYNCQFYPSVCGY
jgi:hypothetical protein